MSEIDDRVEELDVAGYAANIFRRTGIVAVQADGRAHLRVRRQGLLDLHRMLAVVTVFVDVGYPSA
jgi:hypothetical protein